MGNAWSGNVPNVGGFSQGLAQQYASTLPTILNATSAGQGAIDLSQARSAAATTPIYSQAGLTNLQNFALPYALTGANVTNALQEQGAQTQANLLNQFGQSEAQSYRAADAAANPEYYKTLGTATTGLNNLVNSINLNGLSGSERAEVERSLGQSQTATGNLGLDNATNAVSNAMTFGSALQQKRDALASALNTATNLMGQSRNGFNPSSVMANSGTAGTGNIGTNNFTGVATPGNQAYGMGTSQLGNLTGLTATSLNQQFTHNQANSISGIGNTVTSQVGNLCCFIFLESYNGKLPDSTRMCRDLFYRQNPDAVRGYKKMAKVLVPLMRKYPVIKMLVNRYMVKPITNYGEYLFARRPYNEKERQCFEFWMNVWKFVGTH